MPTERLTRERRRDLTRTALLDAAAEVFAQRGFAAASLDEIAETAGFTRGAITFNFGTKDDLFLAVVERHNDELLAAYSAVLDHGPQAGAPDLNEVAGVWKHFEAGDTNTLMLVLELRLYALRNADARDKIAAFEQRMEQAVGQFVAQQAAAAKVELPLPANELGAILYAATYGLQQHVAICSNNHDALFGQFIELLMNSSTRATTASSSRTRGSHSKARSS
jgi:AcrR family transcriptional regulator